MMNKVRSTLSDIWLLDGTRWAELLLASIKIALGTGILSSFNSPAILARFGQAWMIIGFALASFVLIVGVAQAIGVLWGKLWLRQASLVGGTFIWSFYAVLTLTLGGTLQGVLVYVPLLAFNVAIIKRLRDLRVHKEQLKVDGVGSGGDS